MRVRDSDALRSPSAVGHKRKKPSTMLVSTYRALPSLACDEGMTSSFSVIRILFILYNIIYIAFILLVPVLLTKLLALATNLPASFAACPATSLAAIEISPIAFWH